METEIAFKPFKPLRSEGSHLEDKVEHITALIQKGHYEEAIDASTELTKSALAGLRYLQTYSPSYRLFKIIGMTGSSCDPSSQRDSWDGLFSF